VWGGETVIWGKKQNAILVKRKTGGRNYRKKMRSVDLANNQERVQTKSWGAEQGVIVGSNCAALIEESQKKRLESQQKKEKRDEGKIKLDLRDKLFTFPNKKAGAQRQGKKKSGGGTPWATDRNALSKN